jgi:hypothetical protein
MTSFDGRRYGQVIETRKIHYHSRAPHVGFVLGTNLRNSYCVAENRGRTLVQKSWPRNMERPWIAAGFFDPDENIDEVDFETFFVWHADMRAEAGGTPVVRDYCWAHICFTVYSELATLARFRFEVDDGSTSEFATADVVLGADAAARIPEGSLSPFESRGGSYEATFRVALSGLGAVRKFIAQAYATHLNSQDPPVLEEDAVRIDVVDLFTE